MYSLVTYDGDFNAGTIQLLMSFNISTLMSNLVNMCKQKVSLNFGKNGSGYSRFMLQISSVFIHHYDYMKGIGVFE